MTDDIKWACEWVGWERINISGEECWRVRLGAGKSTLIHDESPMLSACLGEAVRVKFYELWLITDEGTDARRSISTLDRIKSEWLACGPLAFIKVVREVVTRVRPFDPWEDSNE